MRKFLVTALFLPLLFLALPEAAPNAQARVNVNVNINVGGRISCRQGVRIVERRGFRNVRSRSCKGSTFVYSGRRSGRDYSISVRSRDGRIVNIRRR